MKSSLSHFFFKVISKIILFFNIVLFGLLHAQNPPQSHPLIRIFQYFGVQKGKPQFLVSLGLTPKDYANLCRLSKEFRNYFHEGKSNPQWNPNSQSYVYRSYFLIDKQFKKWLRRNPKNKNATESLVVRFEGIPQDFRDRLTLMYPDMFLNWFQECQHLKALSFSECQLKSLPKSIVLLTNLQVLYLYKNQLRALPREIGQLINLQWLDVSNNQLSKLSSAIERLANLQSLDVSNNQLSELPREISQLTNLHELYISNNQLRRLPREIGLLTNLQTLYLYINQLRELPREISQLTNLKVLAVSNNQLKELPMEISQLTNLQTLYLYNNQLSVLPNAILLLTNLQSLNVSKNQLSESEVGFLESLRVPDLRFSSQKNPNEAKP